METWVNVVGYEGLYLVSDLGRVMTVPRQRGAYNSYTKKKFWGKMLQPKILKQSLNEAGYPFVYLTKPLSYTGKCPNVHRLVMVAFKGLHKTKTWVNHKNAIKTDNRLKNLEWTTPKQNMRHASKNGLLGGQRFNTRLSTIKQKNIQRKYISGEKTLKELSKYYKISFNTIRRISKKKL